MAKKSLFHYANNPRILITSIKIALIVGTILAFINHFDNILAYNLNSEEKIKILITYFVPFSVATYSAAIHARRLDRIRQWKMRKKTMSISSPSFVPGAASTDEELAS